jgi:CheY-like chemotaxis protein
MNDIKKILLVDDDQEDQEIFEVVLSEIDDMVNFICAGTAEAALNTLKNSAEKPDYIFLDLNLPLMNGFECLDVIKSNDRLQNIPVVIYSTSSRDTDIEKAKALGAAEYITKPNTFSELKIRLQTVLSEDLNNAAHAH